MNREQLIEDAVQALEGDAWQGHDDELMREDLRLIVQRVWSVFEGAYTPTDDEREARIRDVMIEMLNKIGRQSLSVDLVRGIVNEWERCAVCRRTDGSHKMSCRPQNRVDAERTQGGPSASCPDVGTGFVVRQEPQGEPTTLARMKGALGEGQIIDVSEPQGEPSESVAGSDTAFELGRVAGYDEAMREMQGDPSDAQLLAQGFTNGVNFIDNHPGPWGAGMVAGRAEAARLRAAAETGGER